MASGYGTGSWASKGCRARSRRRQPPRGGAGRAPHLACSR
jgi:hypothetical protein